MPYTGTFRLQNEVKLQFEIEASRMHEASISNSDFRIFEILTKLKQNWCSNGAQFRQLCSIFEFFEIREFRIIFENSKLNAVRGIGPSDFKNFWPHYV